VLRKRPNFLPVIAHNANAFDAHLVFRAMIEHPRLTSNTNVHIIPKTHEGYRGFSIQVGPDGRALRMMDSYQFFSQSLDTISKNLAEDDLGLLEEVFPDPDQRALLKTKCIFPYEYAQSYEQLLDTTELPPRAAFHSSLSQSVPSEEEYRRALNVWQRLGCQNLLQFMEFYMLLDTVLLSAFFTKYRQLTYRKYGLEVCHFWSAPGLSFKAAFKFTKAKVQLLSDPDMYQFFERQTRGGFTFIGKRYSEANVPGSSTYNPSLPEKHILNLDVNALYSHEMQKKLPISEFEWVTAGELERIDWTNLDEEADVMYTVCVDLDYPEELHDKHDEFPCAVEKMAVREEWMSPYQCRLAELGGVTRAQLSEPKLIAHLGPRKEYVVHGTVLKYYLKMGLRVTRFVSGIRYQQEAWLRPYIQDLMTSRQATAVKFEQEYLKLLSNSCYGQLLRNPRFDRNIEIVRTPIRFRKVVAKPSFKSFTIFGEDLIAVEKLPTEVKLDKCVFAGTTVLDYSKRTMHELYSTLKEQFKDRMKICFSDTDSMCVEVETNRINDELRAVSHIMDMSGFPPSHPLHSKEFQRVTGRLKVEYGDLHILKFVGLRAKCYALDMEARGEKKTVLKCKGVQKSAMQRSVTFEDYKKCLFENLEKEVQFCSIRTDGKHRLFTLKQSKTALRQFDNKRWIQPDGVITRAYRPPQSQQDDEDGKFLYSTPILTSMKSFQNNNNNITCFR
jgi:hypothetical protein